MAKVKKHLEWRDDMPRTYQRADVSITASRSFASSDVPSDLPRVTARRPSLAGALRRSLVLALLK